MQVNKLSFLKVLDFKEVVLGSVEMNNNEEIERKGKRNRENVF